MADEKELIKKRGSYKGRLTAFTNYLNTLSTSSLTAIQAGELQLRISKIENLYEQYDEVQLSLECSSENSDAQISERTAFEAMYYSSLSKAQDMLACFGKSYYDEKDKSSCSRTNNNKLVKLPTIQLPKFSGSYENWLEFRDTFTSLIHSNDEIDDINKFHYLKACLDGTAMVTIQSVDLSASNYSIAWGLLCDQFDNKRLLIQNHVSSLFNIDPIIKESSFHFKRVIDQLKKNLRALESLGEPVKQWDTLLIHMMTLKLDPKTYREWEETKRRTDKNVSITFETFISFLRDRAECIEAIELARNNTSTTGQNNSSKSQSKIKSMVSVQSVSTTHENVKSVTSKPCQKCSGDHKLIECPSFLALTSDKRLELLPSYKVCYNCLSRGHFSNKCKKSGCKICKRKHNTLIHVMDFKGQSRCETGISEGRFGPDSQPQNTSSPLIADARTKPGPSAGGAAAAPLQPQPQVSLSASIATPATNTCDSLQSEVLLSTALVKLYNKDNEEYVARAVLDCGSTSCIMTENMYRKLNLPCVNVNKSILGINSITSQTNKVCRVAMKSLSESFSTEISCYILPTITEKVPCHQVNLSKISIPSNICLADPNFHSPAEVDLILGADIFWDLLGSQRINLGDGQPILYETRLGWLVSGPVNCGNASTSSHSIKCNFIKVDPYHSETDDSNNELQNQLARFWQLEEVNKENSHYSVEEQLCEEHFTNNTKRLDNGNFCVRLPLKQDPSVLGDSFQRAKRCLLSLERRFQSQPLFKERYHQFMSEYESLGHMTESQKSVESDFSYFIPHHGILRENSTTTKLRAVFNASSPSTSGVSLNNIQMVGPTVQDDLLSILIRFRQYKYILAGDVEKMYRQVVVHPEDRCLQKILWRFDTSEPMKIYDLNTVTYGTASAPFLATRCLRQIGLDCCDDKIKEIILHDFYVDDLLTGGDLLSEVGEIKDKVTKALSSAGMPLRKWKSNEPLLVSASSQSAVDLNIGGSEPCKTLGLGWMTDSDTLYFTIDSNNKEANTKRSLLSVISQTFDPLGVLSPCIIKMKVLLQKLWVLKVSWDDKLPSEVLNAWDELLISLPALNELRIPRIVTCDSYNSLELHIFSDASQIAYGACAYVRSVNDLGEVLVRLLLSKSRVAPIKPTTIPRLELCGALIGTKIYEKIVNSLRGHISRVVFWTDSTIVLGWLRMHPNKLQPFVRNRVAEILEKTGDCTWKHVPTDQNPADHISRGVSPASLQALDLWWSGPNFLKEDASMWPRNPVTQKDLPEVRPEVVLNAVSHNNTDNGDGKPVIDFKRFSNFARLKRTVAYVLRFINMCKRQSIATAYLTDDELQNALNVIVRISQKESFPEYNMLLQKQNINKKSSLQKFNVFLDGNKLMRVGGRLENSEFPYEKKHPLIIQSTHHVTKLLFKHEHQKLMHAGPQLLLASIRERFWPIGGRKLAKACYRQCVLCTRVKSKIVNPLMGNLPQQRISPGGYPFKNVGVDYAGPISSASRQGRGCRLVKVYIAIFICFTTKAIHLELVGDLTSNNYLCALRRFMSRRGKPEHIYSDNGTSFVGAYNDLSKFLKANCDSLAESVANEGLNFHFIPAYTPHFGGLWEAGVKSTKFHLVRVLGNCNLTYEELNTVLTQIEAILNSRPLTPLSADPNDDMPLTPGHFLIGRPMMSLPAPDYQDHSTNYLSRFQRIEQLRQHFWARWSKEYVAELQQRVKWRCGDSPLKMNALVILKENNLPPLKWKLGRVVAVYPGSDGVNRVADVKTSNGVVRRAFSKICPLLDPDVPA